MKDLTEIILAPISQLQKQSVVGLHEPDLTGNELAYVTECIKTGWVSSVGKFVDKFEETLAEYVGVEKSVAVVNGTSGLHLALLLMGVTAGDEVLTPALTFVATTNSIAYTGAIPHFIDSGEKDLSICPDLLEKYLDTIVELRQGVAININTGRKITALIIMHAIGHPAKVIELVRVARKYNLKVIEDAAEGVGSFVGKQHVGTIADIGVFSFNGNKIMTTGSGGALVSHDIDLMKKAKHLSTTAKVSTDGFFYHDAVGFNYRMSNINAALGVAQLERIDEFVALKNKLASYYRNYFSNFSSIKFIMPDENTSSNFWLCTIKINEANDQSLASVIQGAHAQGVMLRPLWALNSDLPMYKDSPSMCLENAKKFVGSCLCLPSGTALARCI